MPSSPLAPAFTLPYPHSCPRRRSLVSHSHPAQDSHKTVPALSSPFQARNAASTSCAPVLIPLPSSSPPPRPGSPPLLYTSTAAAVLLGRVALLESKPSITLVAPVGDEHDYFSPRVVRRSAEDEEGLCPHCTVLGTDESLEPHEVQAWYSLRSAAYDHHLSLTHGVSPDFHTTYHPPIATQPSTVSSLFGNIDDGLCGACGAWVVGAHCHGDASGRVPLRAPPPPPSLSTALLTVSESYRPLFAPSFSTLPLASLPPPLFASVSAARLSLGAWTSTVTHAQPADDASDPTASPLDARVPARASSPAASTSGPEESPLAARIRVPSWGRELERAWAAASGPRVQGAREEAEKENDPAATTMTTARWTLRPRVGKRKAEVEDKWGCEGAKRARQ
ncbi:hypothetical protein JCM10449v2_005386 [Rhodotorula kratochvilovae]